MGKIDQAGVPFLRAVAPFWVAAMGGTTLTWVLLGTPWLAVLGHIALLALIFHLWHRAMHDPRSGPLYRQHARHHDALHSAERFLAVRYLGEGGLLQEVTLSLAAAALLVASARLGTAPWTLTSCAVAYVVVVAAGAWLHRAMHTSGHWLGGIRWFRDLRKLHWLHHVDPASNMGIIECAFDAVFGTLRRARS